MTVLDTPPTVSRRTALGGLATAGGIAVSAGALLATQPDPASASVDVESLAIADEAYESADGQPAEVWLICRGYLNWESSDALPDGYAVALDLAASDPDAGGTYATLADVSGRLTTYSGSKRFELRARLSDHPEVAVSDVAAPEASTTTETPLWVRVSGAVERDGETLAAAEATDNALLSVSNTSVAITTGIEGSGGVHVQANSSDPTPTVAA